MITNEPRKTPPGVRLDMSPEADVAVIGLGYVGLTLACTLADRGFNVWGYERQPEVVSRLRQGRPHIFEPGVEQTLRAHLGTNLTIEERLPEKFGGTFILCVSTPIGADHTPDLSNLRAAVTSVADSAESGALVIVRSTVPVGTCRKVVLPVLQKQLPSVRLASCPERTIQGRALEELRALPQIVGGLDEASTEAAVELWQQVTHRVVPVSSLEAAEMVKLINNSHTDLIYSFGNEVALMAQGLGLDPIELIQSANLDYPRPDLARPGFVGGPCISKDPYILLESVKDTGYVPHLVTGARKLNESLPKKVAWHFLERLGHNNGGIVEGSKVFVCGFAYKGWPATDDLRDAPAIPILKHLSKYSLQLYGHDPLVSADSISACGATPVEDVRDGFDGAQGVLFINEHPDYRALPIEELAKTMRQPATVYDCWRMFDNQRVQSVPGVHYSGIGYG